MVTRRLGQLEKEKAKRYQEAVCNNDFSKCTKHVRLVSKTSAQDKYFTILTLIHELLYRNLSATRPAKNKLCEAKHCRKQNIEVEKHEKIHAETASKWTT